MSLEVGFAPVEACPSFLRTFFPYSDDVFSVTFTNRYMEDFAE